MPRRGALQTAAARGRENEFVLLFCGNSGPASQSADKISPCAAPRENTSSCYSSYPLWIRPHQPSAALGWGARAARQLLRHILRSKIRARRPTIGSFCSDLCAAPSTVVQSTVISKLSQKSSVASAKAPIAFEQLSPSTHPLQHCKFFYIRDESAKGCKALARDRHEAHPRPRAGC